MSSPVVLPQSIGKHGLLARGSVTIRRYRYGLLRTLNDRLICNYMRNSDFITEAASADLR